VIDLVTTVVAIEALCAAQAIDLRRPLEPAPGTGAALARLRERIPFLEEDRDVSVDIEAAGDLVRSGSLVSAAEGVVGELR
jgi:histidine ammonia-lyase